MRENNIDGAELTALSRERPKALDPAGLGGSRRQHDDLAAILSTQPPAARPAGHRNRSRRWIAVPVGGVAVVAAGAVAIATAMSGPSAIGAASRTPQSIDVASGPAVLLDAAGVVENETGSGAYWVRLSSNSQLAVVPGASPYAVRSTAKTIWSDGIAPGTQSRWAVGVDATVEPISAHDRSLWQAAGSPTTVRADFGYGNARGGANRLLPERIGQNPPQQDLSGTGADIFAHVLTIGTDNYTLTRARELPTTVAGLTALLNNAYAHAQGTEGYGDKTAWLLDQAIGITQAPVPAAVRATAFRFMAGLPGITWLGSMTDPLGRQGVGVALPVDHDNGLGAGRRELIVDPASGTLLTEEEVLVQPGAQAAAAGLTAGTVLDYQATTQIGWSDQPTG